MAREYTKVGAAVALATLLTLGALIFGPGTAQALPQYSYGCDFCHQMPPKDSGTAKKNPFTGGVPGNHETHANGETSSCLPCHGGDVTAYGGSHRNKVIELDDAINYTRKQPGVFLNQTTVPPNPLGTCSNVACHSDGKGNYRLTAAWGSAPSETNCSSCHDAAPNTGMHFVKHAAYFGNGVNACAKCHADHASEAKPFQHATSAGKRAIDVRFGAAPNNGGSFAANQCSNLYCHSDGRGNYKTVSWAAGTTLDCSGCHGSATSTDQAALSGAHGKHVNNAAYLGTNYTCSDCHFGVTSGNSAIADTAKHVNGQVELAGSQLGSVTSGTCSTSYCHSDGKGTFKNVNWTQAQALGCNGCHGTGNATGAPDYANAGAGLEKANNHDKHVTSAADCVNCHAKTTLNGTSILAGGQHIDGFNNFSAGTGVSFGKLPNKTCSNISCHSGNGVVQNVAPAQWGAHLDCSGCHSTLSSAHTAHTGLYGCVDCHSTTVSSNTVVSNPANHLNNKADVAGVKVTTFTPADQSCATSCHMSATPKWNVAASGQCGTCHNMFTPLINTGAHAAHFTAPQGPQMAQTVASCQVCHVYNGETAVPHGDGITNMNAGYPANGACSDCHKQTSTQWFNAASVTCESCHSTAGGALSVISNTTAPDETAAAINGHGKPGIDKSCADCHDKNSQHINGTLGDKRLLSALGSGNDNTECSYCHSDPAKVAAKNLYIKTHMASGLGSLCSDCHNAHGTAPNTMMVKQVINGTAVSFTGNNTFANDARTGVCQVCHVSTQYFTKAGQPQTTHVDSTQNCLDCHSHNPTDGYAFSANGACDACHGYPPAPRKTISASVFGVQGNWTSARFEDYSGGGGAHTIAGHVPKDLKITNTSADWTPCLPCHYDAAASHAKTLPIRSHVENVSVTIDPQYRFSPDYFISYTTMKFVSGGANKTGTCFNTSCHMAPSPKWSIER